MMSRMLGRLYRGEYSLSVAFWGFLVGDQQKELRRFMGPS